MDIRKNDAQFVWHPFTVYNQAYPMPVSGSKGSYIYNDKGEAFFDAISSWWVTIHGHSHPYIAEKLYEQFFKLDHVLFAGFTHEKAVELASRLINILPKQFSKVFYSDNGSTAVEVAVKIALQYWKNKGNERRTIISFDNAYHGDTFGAMSVSARSMFNQVFEPWMFDVCHIPAPVHGQEKQAVEALKKIVSEKKAAVFIYEPLVMGAGGMLMYKAGELDKLLTICRENKIICIADEVMTGFGRTGTMFASEQMEHKPDIICLSKGITGGCLPLGATVVNETVFDAFRSSDIAHTFWHGHSYTANPLSCAAACASLDLFEQEQTMLKVKMIKETIAKHMKSLDNTDIVKIRQCGTIAAFEFQSLEGTSYTNTLKHQIIDFFFQHQIIVRPLGNILYFMPPYSTVSEEIQHLFDTLQQLIYEMKR
jgi:adenosylmethionine-8-amino-7-oxononanoate aminotransferase